jgi:phospholipid/cholesterol/gamma-HCH transport system substrate-binding protein
MKMTFVKVGIFSVIAVLMTVALGVKLANERLFADQYKMQAAFEDATGVLKGDSVKVAGIDVGRVRGFQIEDGQAVVEFTVDDDVELPKDSTATLRWRNVLGQRFLYLFPGGENELFEEGDRIPAEQTDDVADIGELLNKAGPILKAIDPRDANAFLDSVNTALEGNEQDVRQLIDDGAQLAETLADEDENIKQLISSADKIMAAYASQDDALGQIFDDLDTVGSVLRRRINDVTSLVDNFSEVQAQLDELVTTNRGNIDASLSSLEKVAKTLKNNRANLAETLETLPFGVSGYWQTTSWGEWFNVRIVQINVRDQQSNPIVDERENETQRPSKGGSPDVGDGAGNGYEKDEDGDDGDPKGKDKGRNDGDGDRPRQDISAILRFIFTGIGGDA